MTPPQHFTSAVMTETPHRRTNISIKRGGYTEVAWNQYQTGTIGGWLGSTKLFWNNKLKNKVAKLLKGILIADTLYY